MDKNLKLLKTIHYELAKDILDKDKKWRSKGRRLKRS